MRYTACRRMPAFSLPALVWKVEVNLADLPTRLRTGRRVALDIDSSDKRAILMHIFNGGSRGR